MVYEVVGLAGAGKSTLVNAIEKELKQKNIPIYKIGVGHFAGEHQGNVKRAFFKTCMVLGCFTPSCITLFLFLTKELLNNVRRKQLKEPIRELYIKILYCCYLKRNYVKHRHELVLVDEGALQSAIAFSIFVGYDDPRILAKEIIDRFQALFKFIIIKISVNDALDRIAMRKRESADIDFMSSEDLSDYLRKYSICMNSIAEEHLTYKLFEVFGNDGIRDSAYNATSRILSDFRVVQ